MRAERIPRVSTSLRIGDRLGGWRVRWTVGRRRFRVEPGLYRIGTPDAESPVLVTANYKLTFDSVRAELAGIDAWLLVLDTRAVNVWCAAGKGTFSTDELVQRVQSASLRNVVSHRTLIVPQLGATGVAAHEVRERCGFRVIWGPVRARDIGAFLGAGMQASDDMRRVSFTLGERLALVGGELAPLAKWFGVFVVAIILANIVGSPLERLGTLAREFMPILLAVLAGGALVPIFLPWIPGRAFSLKGAIAGAVVVGATIALSSTPGGSLFRVQMMLIGTAVSSFVAMQFTGSTTFTSPSGVEWEMRRALPFQLGAVVVAFVIGAVGGAIG